MQEVLGIHPIAAVMFILCGAMLIVRAYEKYNRKFGKNAKKKEEKESEAKPNEESKDE